LHGIIPGNVNPARQGNENTLIQALYKRNPLLYRGFRRYLIGFSLDRIFSFSQIQIFSFSKGLDLYSVGLFSDVKIQQLITPYKKNKLILYKIVNEFSKHYVIKRSMVIIKMLY
jgi:hypothetical protein